MNGENVNDDPTTEPLTNDSQNHDSENGSVESSENYEQHINHLNVTKFNMDKINANKHFTIKNKDDKWMQFVLCNHIPNLVRVSYAFQVFAKQSSSLFI